MNEIEVAREESMTIEEQVIEKLRALPPERQKEVLDFVDSLNEKTGTKKPRESQQFGNIRCRSLAPSPSR
jgi:mRNA-degrading endonuclease RelE of RelBE toxin-antitoxin system